MVALHKLNEEEMMPPEERRRSFIALVLAVVGGPILLHGSVPWSFGESYSHHGDSHLKAFIEQALVSSPLLRQSLASYRASLQQLPQVSALPDPMLGLTQHVRHPETRVGPQTTMLTLSQRFPWFGKLRNQEQIYAKRALVLREQYRTHKAELIRQVKAAYYTLAYLDRVIRITQEEQSTLEHYETLAQSRYSQGIGLLQGVVKLQAQITRAQNRLQLLRSQRVDAEAELNRLRDLPAATPIKPVTLPGRPVATIDFDKLREMGRLHRPEIRAALHRIEQDEKRIQLAKKSYWPDFTLGAGFINVLGRSDPAGRLIPPTQNGKNIYSFTVGINLPIHRRRHDAAILEATEATISSREAYRSMVNQVEASIRAIGFRIQTLQEQILLFERTLLPQAEQVLRSTEDAYSTGRLGVLDLLDSERELLQVQMGLARLISDYMKALAELERAVGAPLREVKK